MKIPYTPTVEPDPISEQLVNMQKTPRKLPCTPDERQFIVAEQAAGISPEEIAAHLIQRRALDEVQQVIRDAETKQARAEHPRIEQTFSFLPPPPTPTAQEIAAGHRNKIQPVVVKESQFSDFCTANGLDEVAMMEVWNGNLFEHHLWRQRRAGPEAYAVKEHQRKVWELNRDMRDRDEKEAREYQKRLKAAVTNESPYAEPADWSPDKPAPKTSHVQVVRLG